MTSAHHDFCGRHALSTVSGFGVYEWASTGNMFEGHWVNGFRHFGCHTTPNDVHTGEWLQGKRHGEGRTQFTNGAS